jgi:hypothetical protein
VRVHSEIIGAKGVKRETVSAGVWVWLERSRAAGLSGKELVQLGGAADSLPEHGIGWSIGVSDAMAPLPLERPTAATWP